MTLPGGTKTWWIVAVTALLGAAVWGWLRLPSKAVRDALGERAEVVRVLAAALAAQRPGAVVVVTNPFAQRSGAPEEARLFERAALETIRRVFNGRRVVEVVATLTPEAERNPSAILIPSSATTPLSYMIPADAFERVARSHADCPLLLSLVGLPAGIERTAWWRSTNGPALGLLLPDFRVIGPPEEARQAFERGRILAAIADGRNAARHFGMGFAGAEGGYVLLTPELLAAAPRVPAR